MDPNFRGGSEENLADAAIQFFLSQAILEVILNFIEKRIFRRLKTEIPVEVEQAGQTLRASTSNISCGGMFLRVDPQKMASQKQVEVAIHLPSQKIPVKLLGEVRRSESDGVAVEFRELYNDNILAIERYVKSNLN